MSKAKGSLGRAARPGPAPTPGAGAADASCHLVAGKAPKRAPLPGRDRFGHWLPGVCGCPPEKQRIVKGHQWRYPPGVSGNPAGIPQRRREFEAAFYDALMGRGSPDEAARLLWECARSREPWAVQLLLQRIAPEANKVKLEVTRGQDDAIDYSKLTDEQLRQLEAIVAAAQPPALAGGEVPT